MKIKYIIEGYFKNPTQAKNARAAASQKTNAEKLAATTQHINDTQVKNEIEKIISESLSKTSAFPFSTVFMQPMGNSGHWDFTNPVNNLQITEINDTDKTIKCYVDAGVICDRGLGSSINPVTSIVAIREPRLAKEGLDLNSSAEDVLKILTEKPINVIKNKAVKQLKSRSLPNSAIYVREALKKIIEYDFIVEKVVVGVTGQLRIKNIWNPDDYKADPDKDFKDFIFSLITFVPYSADACIKIKNSKNKEIDSGVTFNFNDADDIAKEIVEYCIKSQVCFLLRDVTTSEIQAIQKYDSEHKYLYTNNELKCKRAVAAIHRELLAYLAKSQSITIKNIQFTYERMNYTTIDLKTKAETDELDTSRTYGRGVKITYSLPGDTEDSYIYASRKSSLGTYDAWNVINVSSFLKNGLKPTTSLSLKSNSFWYDDNMELLNNTKKLADATNLFLNIYYDRKILAIKHSLPESFHDHYDYWKYNKLNNLPNISDLSNGRYTDITDKDAHTISNLLFRFFREAKEQL